MSLLMMVLLSMFSYAQQINPTVPLKPGHEVLVDVKDFPLYVPLGITSPASKENVEVTAEVTSQWSGFECEIYDIGLSGYSHEVREDGTYYTYDWEILVTWKPGGDLSGCKVVVHTPGLKDSYAEIFMQY